VNDVQMDDFTVTSQNTDSEAVRATLSDPDPATPPETPAETGERPAVTTSTDATAETPETPETSAAAQARDAKGQYAKGGRKPSLQDRLNHTVWEREEVRRENARLQAEMEALRRGSPASAPPSGPPPAPAGPTGKPELADFDTHEEWADALVAWHMQQRDARDMALGEARRDSSLRTTYAEREDAILAVHPDYRDVMATVATVPIGDAIKGALLTSDRGPALAYFLATHPEVATDLIAEWIDEPMSAAPRVRRLLELYVPVSPAPSGSGNGIRHVVPPPISPVGASPIVADPTPIDDLPPDEYVDAMNARERADRLKGSTLRR
jgi:hypothetical protein